MGLDHSETLTATITPENATNTGAVWSSNNTSVAIVDQEGKVTAIAEGIAIITITTYDGLYTAKCIVIVESVTGAPKITMTTGSFSIEFSLQGTNSVLIDWGDGTIDIYSPNADIHILWNTRYDTVGTSL